MIGGYGQSARPSLDIDPSKGLWRLAVQAKPVGFPLTAKAGAAPDKSDGRCVLISSKQSTVCMDVSLKARALWNGSGKDAKVWRAPSKAWAAIAASIRNLRPFPPKAGKSHGSG